MGRALAEVLARFDGGGSALAASMAAAVGRSDDALRALAAVPPRRRQPAVVLAALHDLALAGRAPELAAAFDAGDPEAAGAAAVGALLTQTDAVAALAVRHRVRTHETSRSAVLHPAVAEAAHRAGADTVGLVDVGWDAGLDLPLDRIGIDHGAGGRRGDPASPVQLTCTLVGDRPLPAGDLPRVVARVRVDVDPLDVTDPDDARWLRACVGPGHPELAARLDAELALATTAPPQLMTGDPVELLPGAVDRVPAGALPVVVTAWALSRVPPARRLRFLAQLAAVAAVRPVAWVSVEGVGVAPSVPTLGDRPASGHSTVAVAVSDGSGLRPEAVGRCWSRGRTLSWLVP